MPSPIMGIFKGLVFSMRLKCLKEAKICWSLEKNQALGPFAFKVHQSHFQLNN